MPGSTTRSAGRTHRIAGDASGNNRIISGCASSLIVMAGEGRPSISSFVLAAKTWMAGTSPGHDHGGATDAPFGALFFAANP